MILILIAVALFGFTDQGTSFSFSNLKNKDKNCRRNGNRVVQNKLDLEALRFNATTWKFFNPQQPDYVNSVPGLQAIVGGSRAYRRQYPWVALLLLTDKRMVTIKRCTGVALNSIVMMTAAHCTPRDEEETLAVLLGFNDQFKAGQESTSVTFVQYSEIFTPRLYDLYGRRTHSIAVFPYNLHTPSGSRKPWLRPNQYPVLHLEGKLKYGQYCTILGFGLVDYEQKTQARYLQKGSVSIVSGTAPVTVIRFDTPYRGGPCAGDEGGPLLCNMGGKYFAKPRLVGIIIGSAHRPEINDTCNLSNSQDTIGHAVKISDHFMWISRILNFFKDRSDNVV